MKLLHCIAFLGVWAAISGVSGPTFHAQNHSTLPKAASPEAYIGRGYQYIESRRYAEAAQAFRAALSLNPHLIQARYQLAICEFALGRLQEARANFDRLENEASGNPQVIYYLGRLDLKEGNNKQAIHELLKISSSPPYPDTTYYLGSAYLNEGKLSEAEKWLLLAARANPRDFRVADHLARVYQKEKRTAEAEREYSLSARLRNHYDEGADEAVTCGRALQTRPLAQARAVCQQLFDPRDPDKLTLLGMIYGRAGDYQDALPPLELADRLDPESWAVEHNLGLTEFRLRRYVAALAPLQKAVALRPEYFGSTALLGATLYTLGRDEAAFQALQHAHQLNPQDADTQQLLFNESLLLARRRYLKKNYQDCLKFLRQAALLRPGDAMVQRRVSEVERSLGAATERVDQPLK